MSSRDRLAEREVGAATNGVRTVSFFGVKYDEADNDNVNSLLLRDREDTVEGVGSARCGTLPSLWTPQSDDAPLMALGNDDVSPS